MGGIREWSGWGENGPEVSSLHIFAVHPLMWLKKFPVHQLDGFDDQFFFGVGLIW